MWRCWGRCVPFKAHNPGSLRWESPQAHGAVPGPAVSHHTPQTRPGSAVQPLTAIPGKEFPSQGSDATARRGNPGFTGPGRCGPRLPLRAPRALLPPHWATLGHIGPHSVISRTRHPGHSALPTASRAMATPAKRRARGPAGEQSSSEGSHSSSGGSDGSDSDEEPIEEVSG